MVEKASQGMDSSASEVGSAEDVVQALLDYLVDPLLPSKSSGREVPSLKQRQSVAKQMHAVVLLYNYYQRKQHPEVEFLGFESFCKLAVILKPTLMGHMKLMHRSDYAELDDLEDQISMTEKAIMDACDISSVLGASKDVPCTEGWPVAKIAVLLTDSSKENCLLQFSSITHGVWSVIEKDLDSAGVGCEDIAERKLTNKRKRVTKKPLRNETNSDRTAFRQLALCSIKEVTGINQSDLMVLESHVIYSLNKEKTAAHFYIMQCTKSINEDLQVPTKDVIESLQGPLVRKNSCSWTVTPVVEYFHVLPYAGILSDWFSREMSSNSLQDFRVGLENLDVSSSQSIGNLGDKDVSQCREDPTKNCNAEDFVGNKAGAVKTESLKQRDNNNGISMDCLAGSFTGPHNMDIDDSSAVCHKTESGSKNTCSTSLDKPSLHETRADILDQRIAALNNFCPHHERMTSAGSNLNGKTSGVEVEMVDNMMNSCCAEFTDAKADTGKKTSSIISDIQDGMPTGDRALVSLQLNSKYLEKLRVTLASKEDALSQTALKVLLQKREKLSRQLRDLEDEMAVCDQNIQTILDGGEDDLALKIEAIIDASNNVCLKSEPGSQDGTCQPFEDQASPQYRRRKLCEALLTRRNSCQELDDICYENNWTLPTYRVAPADGGFLAHVTVKGMDFECSCGSDNVHASPRLARESAGAQMIVKLRSMAGHSK